MSYTVIINFFFLTKVSKQIYSSFRLIIVIFTLKQNLQKNIYLYVHSQKEILIVFLPIQVGKKVSENQYIRHKNFSLLPLFRLRKRTLRILDIPAERHVRMTSDEISEREINLTLGILAKAPLRLW